MEEKNYNNIVSKRRETINRKGDAKEAKKEANRQASI